LVRSGAARLENGTRGGSHYALALEPEEPSIETPAGDEARVLAHLRLHGVTQAGVCSQLLGWNSPQRAGRFLRRLAARGVLRCEGEKRGRRYLLR